MTWITRVPSNVPQGREHLCYVLSALEVTVHPEEVGRSLVEADPPIDLDRAQFEAFFRRHHGELARLAYTLTGDRTDADDMAGDALAAAWTHWPRVRDADYPVAYVRKIVINLAALRTRRAARERRGIALIGQMSPWLDPGPDIPSAVDLQSAVLLLPARRRACVVLRHVLDLSEEEVARTLGVSVGTVKSQTSRGLAQLRQIITQTNPGEVGTHGRRAR